MRFSARLLPSVLVCLVVTLPAFAQAPVTYRVSFPAPEHHYAQIEVTFPNLPAGMLEARMSRSSPGRYALHEYAKNVFELQAFDGKGKVLTADAAESVSMGHRRPRRHRPHRLQDLRRPRRWHLPWHRSDARAHEHAGDADVGSRPGSACRPRHLRSAEEPRMGGGEPAVSNRRCLDIHRSQPSVPDGQPDRAERADNPDLQGPRRGRQGGHDQSSDSPRCGRR